ncbi:hypothetical protein [Tenuibacillus multivorans]|uniref:Uncharacterized protein n=1 Tax=Tenuibacillus multivorans TaxID=237069 RepID=A0A1H0BSX3_9BACI|nr:hypothetical protein [Tenuibacillus multivorans]GEL77047.1 hypothetical protein TMU01_12820 [Tenuibacillus multivorans]SDN48738.1 hypothetical protein SAMN05216498_2375 [Tenuibacillus multivorans]
MSKTELSKYIVWDPHHKEWHIQKIHPEAHTNTNIAFKERGQAFINRIKEDKPYKENDAHPDQLSLFDE